MDCGIWDRLPEELLTKIMAFLPVSNFFPLRGYSKKWKFIFSDPKFVELRIELVQEFIQMIQRCPRFQASKLMSYNDGILLISNDENEMLIIQPSRLFVKLVPSLDVGGKDGNEHVRHSYVVNVLRDQATNNCSLFLAADLVPTEERRLERIRACTLHRYDLNTDVWSRFGKIIKPCTAVDQVVKHRGKYMIMIESVPGSRKPFRIKELEEDTLTWRTWPEGVPTSDWRSQPILFIDDEHLFLLVTTYFEECCLWEHCEEKSKWNLKHKFQALQYTGPETDLIQFGTSIDIPGPEFGVVSDKEGNLLRILKPWNPDSKNMDLATMAMTEEVKQKIMTTLSPRYSWFLQQLPRESESALSLSQYISLFDVSNMSNPANRSSSAMSSTPKIKHELHVATRLDEHVKYNAEYGID